MKKIITHSNKAHRDEFLSICILLAINNTEYEIERRKPLKQEFNDVNTIILDTGLLYEPNKMNFDHHQFEKSEIPKCTFTLLSEYLNLNKIFKLQSWYTTTAQIDVFGPALTANKLGMSKFPYELLSPIEIAILNIFKEHPIPIKSNHYLYQLMKNIGIDIINKSKIYEKKINSLLINLNNNKNSSLSIINLNNNLKGFFTTEKDITGLGYIKENIKHSIKFIVSKDNRGEGWSIYCYNNCHELNLYKLKNNKLIKFAHEKGFIAKTKNNISKQEIITLLNLAKV